ATPARPAADSYKLRKPRIALMDVYGGSMTSGWTRWILEQFEFPYERVFVPQVDQGGLNARYDVLVVPNGVLPDPAQRGNLGGDEAGTAPNLEYPDSLLPGEYRGERGRVTAEKTLPAIRQFVENGGTVIAIGGSSSTVAGALNLPVSNHLVENGQAL